LSAPPTAPPLTRDGMLLGARMIMPIVPGIVFFASAFGTAAAQKGMSLTETVLMSGLALCGRRAACRAGAVDQQLVPNHHPRRCAPDLHDQCPPDPAGASLQPWIGGLPGPVLWPSLFLLTDANWVLGERYRASGGRDAGVLIGAGAALWLFWVVGTIPGRLAGGFDHAPEQFGIDLVMPIFFAAMIVPLWKGRRDAVVWGIAGAVALAAWAIVPGYAFIMAGAFSGALAGALLPEAADAE